MSKHKEAILSLVSTDTIKSTNQLMEELAKKTGKTVNWYLVYNVLRDLESEGKVERLKSKFGIFWRKL